MVKAISCAAARSNLACPLSNKERKPAFYQAIANRKAKMQATGINTQDVSKPHGSVWRTSKANAIVARVIKASSSTQASSVGKANLTLGKTHNLSRVYKL